MTVLKCNTALSLIAWLLPKKENVSNVGEVQTVAIFAGTRSFYFFSLFWRDEVKTGYILKQFPSHPFEHSAGKTAVDR